MPVRCLCVFNGSFWVYVTKSDSIYLSQCIVILDITIHGYTFLYSHDKKVPSDSLVKMNQAIWKDFLIFGVGEQVYSLICIFGEHFGYNGKKVKFRIFQDKEKLKFSSMPFFRTLSNGILIMTLYRKLNSRVECQVRFIIDTCYSESDKF